jgi:intracellular multiplication protein IcmB
VLQDLIGASRTDQVKDMFGKLRIEVTAEQASDLFERYIYDVIRKFQTLNCPTKLDFGPARIIVMDLAEVAPTGSAAANRQTEMMYMLGRHILARNFFLKPDYLRYVPDHVRDYHQVRFQETYEAVKRLDYDEWHRTQGSPQVRAQAELDVREGRKHNIQLGFSSQRLRDMGMGLSANQRAALFCGLATIKKPKRSSSVSISPRQVLTLCAIGCMVQVRPVPRFWRCCKSITRNTSRCS